MSDMEKWEGPIGCFDYTVDKARAIENATLDEDEAVKAFQDACQTFLRNTRNLKLKGGPMNMRGRQAWSSVLQALDGVERYQVT